MRQKVIVVGSGGHAKVVIDILHEMKTIKIHGITSTSFKPGEKFLGYNILGDDNILRDLSNSEYLIAMGLGGYSDNKLRKNAFNFIKSLGFKFVNIIHPSAIISKTVKIGESVVLFPGVVLNTEVQIGDNTIIATGSTVDHETKIGSNVLISAGVTIGAYSKIMDNAVLALGSKAISGISIGVNSVIAAGAVVIKDVVDNEVVYGIPAKKKN